MTNFPSAHQRVAPHTKERDLEDLAMAQLELALGGLLNPRSSQESVSAMASSAKSADSFTAAPVQSAASFQSFLGHAVTASSIAASTASYTDSSTASPAAQLNRICFSATDPEIEHLRTSNAEVLFKSDLARFLRARYQYLGITDAEIEVLLTKFNFVNEDDFADNKKALTLVRDGVPFTRVIAADNAKQAKALAAQLQAANAAESNFLATSEANKVYISAHLGFIDFDAPANNIVRVVRQMRYQSSDGGVIIPDIVVYINGFPLVIFELKSSTNAGANLEQAYQQVCQRYRHWCKDLLKFNAFVVISNGTNAKCGVHLAGYEHFYAWNRIDMHPDQAAANSRLACTTSAVLQLPLVKLIHGMFKPEHLFSILRDFIFFSESASGRGIKIICRYPQFYAASLLRDHIEQAMLKANANQSSASRLTEDYVKGGTYWGSTGCGKSFTMLFLTRLLRRSNVLKQSGKLAELDSAKQSFAHPTDANKLDGLASTASASERSLPTILVLTDRNELNNQILKTFSQAASYLGEDAIRTFDSRAQLKQMLGEQTTGGIYITTIQKFEEETGLLSDRRNIICISDEAHRSQHNLKTKKVVRDSQLVDTQGFAKSLHDSLPRAVYVGFSGTPIGKTKEVFGQVVDVYSMADSIADGITVGLSYSRRAVLVDQDKAKVKEIEQKLAEFADYDDEQIEKAQRQLLKIERVYGAPQRIAAIAQDFVEHYEKRVSQGLTVEGKCLFVAYSREIAYKYYQELIKLRPDWAVKKQRELVVPKYSLKADAGQTSTTSTQVDDTQTQLDQSQQLKSQAYAKANPIAKVNLVLSSSATDAEKNPELAQLVGNDEHRQELERAFKDVNSNFSIAIVVDMWLTGFDVPMLDTIYIDKPIQMQNLIQTISRVNRVYPGKESGLVVDYCGFYQALQDALKEFAYGNSPSPQVEYTDQAKEAFEKLLAELDAFFGSFSRKAEVETMLKRDLDQDQQQHQQQKQQQAYLVPEQNPAQTSTAEDSAGLDFASLASLGTSQQQDDFLLLLDAAEFIQGQPEGKAKYRDLVRRLLKAYNICAHQDLTPMQVAYKDWYKLLRTHLNSYTGEGFEGVQIAQLLSDFFDKSIAALPLKKFDQVDLDVNLLQLIADLPGNDRPNTKINAYAQILSNAIDKLRKKNPTRALEFSERLEKLLDKYNSRSAWDEDLLPELMEEFKKLSQQLAHADAQDPEEARLDSTIALLKRTAVKHGFEYPDEKYLGLAQAIVAEFNKRESDKNWWKKNRVKAGLKADISQVCREHGYPPSKAEQQAQLASQLLEEVTTSLIESEAQTSAR